jgi:hypothetical protein
MIFELNKLKHICIYLRISHSVKNRFFRVADRKKWKFLNDSSA